MKMLIAVWLVSFCSCLSFGQTTTATNPKKLVYNGAPATIVSSHKDFVQIYYADGTSEKISWDQLNWVNVTEKSDSDPKACTGRGDTIVNPAMGSVLLNFTNGNVLCIPLTTYSNPSQQSHQ